MKWLKWLIGIIILLIAALVICIPSCNNYQTSGEISISGLSAPVKIVRDEKGMPAIYADNIKDALRAQGFVTAQDRLFQMELTRLFAEGRICELAGDTAVKLDTRMRTLGFHRMARKHTAILNKESREFVQAYLDGVNEFIKTRKDEWHLEFKLAGITPTPWTIDDSLAIFYYMGWQTGANAHTEVISQMLIEKLGIKKAREIFPININPDNEDNYAAGSTFNDTSSAQLRLDLHKDESLMAILQPDRRCSIGSNNWAMMPKLTEKGKTIVCNDPHLDARMLPGPWYPSAIITGNLRAVGIAMPGVPGILIGRNEHVAVGITNSYGDAQDLYVETLDPKNKNNYLEGKRSIPFTVIKETLKIKDKKAENGFTTREIAIRTTRRGPVISGVMPDLKTKHLITVRFSPFETMTPEIGINEVLTANSVARMKAALGKVTFVMLNFTFGDSQGNIGWQTTGRLPIRSQGDSTIPYVVRNSTDNWQGFIPFDRMPAMYNPGRGWLGTCNHNTVKKGYPWYVSSYFSPSYRYRRLKELMSSKKKFTAEDHWLFQRDTKNMMAEKLAPLMAEILLSDKKTERLGKILSEWNYIDDKKLAAPMVFQSVYRKFAIMTFQDELGEELTKTMLDVMYFWQERLQYMMLKGSSPWFDNITTDKNETMSDIMIAAGRDVLKEHGSNPECWKWGKAHKVEFVSPIMRKGFLKKSFGGGIHPMSGSAETLYRAIYKYSEPFNAYVTASLRMVVDFADSDKVLAVLPGGVTGRQFHDHLVDQIPSFMNGDRVYWWFSDQAINEHAKDTYTLKPVDKASGK